jgi:hypothetical protein
MSIDRSDLHRELYKFERALAMQDVSTASVALDMLYRHWESLDGGFRTRVADMESVYQIMALGFFKRSTLKDFRAVAA